MADEPVQRWIGDKPVVVHKRESYDPYAWRRASVARKFGISIYDVADEPDNAPESPEQAWDEELRESK